AVEMSAQIAERARADEILVSSTVKDLVAGSGINFEERAVQQLRGVQGQWRLFAVMPDREATTILQPAAKLPTELFASVASIDSLAILPLANASGDADMEYLSDGVAENIIDKFSQLSALRVMAW